jgi:hypothetical protein
VMTSALVASEGCGWFISAKTPFFKPV